ncbi:hypothetical protein [Planctomicrobium sp. SH664]|uniref:hypothetical protein n=1 Tax=Planctomicrobium sp. SH664 TaxID=3448125 RepID=UPI003F5BE251
MSFQFDQFDRAFSQNGAPPPLRRRKSFREISAFGLGNLLLLPMLIVIHASVAGEGIAKALPVFQRKLHSLPIPGAAYARNYQGFDKIDLSFVAAVGLFFIATLAWRKLFLILAQAGGSLRSTGAAPSTSLIQLGISLCIIVADAALFWAGLASQSASGWSDSPAYVAPLATLLFTAITASVAAWHADFHTSRYS